MCEGHALGAPRAAGGELEEGDVLAADLRDVRVPARQRGQLVDRHHPAEPRDLRPDQARQGEDLGEGDEEARLGGPQDAGLPPQVVLDLALAGRRIERHRDAAGAQDTAEGGEVFQGGGEHEPHGLPRLETQGAQTGGHGAGPPVELAVGQRLGLVVSGIEQDVPPVRMALNVPVEHLEQRPRAVRRGLPRLQGSREILPEHEAGRSTLLRKGFQEVARGLGLSQDRFGQPGAEGALQPLDQLDPAEAVEPEVALQRGIERRPHVPPPRLELAHHGRHDLQHFLGGDGGGLGARLRLGGHAYTSSPISVISSSAFRIFAWAARRLASSG